MFVVLALLFYFLGFVYGGFVVQFQGLSLVFLFLSLFVVVFSPVYARDVLPLLGLFLLVPLPAGFFDWLTPWLSRVVGELVGWFTGSVFVSGPGYGVLYVDSPVGVVGFEVARACTGIVTLSSVLSVVPVVLYLLAFSPRGLGWRVLAAVLSLVVGLGVGFLGNVVRVLLVVVGTRLWGPGVGLGLFHYSPSIVYAALAVLGGFWVAERVGGLSLSLPRLRVGVGPGSVRGVLGVLVLLLVLVGLFAGVVEAVNYVGGGGGVVRGRVVVPSFGDFVGDPLGYISGGDLRVVSSVEDEWLTSVLNALVVYRVVVESGGGVFNGFVEVVDNPARLHTWQLCLQLQGYRVLDSYSRSVNGSLLNVLVLEKGYRGFVLVYRLIPVTLVLPGGESHRLWVRVSLLAPGGEGVVDELSRVLLLVGPVSEGDGLGVYVGAIRVLSVFVYILVFIIVLSAIRLARSGKGLGVSQGWISTR